MKGLRALLCSFKGVDVKEGEENDEGEKEKRASGCAA